MDKHEANRRMKFAFGELNGSNSGYPSGYRGEKNWKSRQSVAWSVRKELKSKGYHWQAARIANYRNRLHRKYHA